MTLKEYIEGLNNFAKENPDTLEMQVVTSGDIEGNGFFPVLFTPGKGIYEDGEFIDEENYEYEEREESETNAICVN